MKFKSIVTIAVLALTVFGLNANAATGSGLVGNTYGSAVVNATDLRSGVTANSIYGATLGANVAAFNHVDIGGAVALQRLQDNKLDVNNFGPSLNVTVYQRFGILTPYVRGEGGWLYARQNTKHFQAFNYTGSLGTEVALFKNLSVGGDVSLSRALKATTGGTNRSYRGYATFWLNDHTGVTGSYNYNAVKNSVTYTLGSVLRF